MTPATKADEGHDLNIDEGEAEELCGRDRYAAARDAALALYGFGATLARRRGIVLADTKFEFGVDVDGRVTLADEAMTPDSSRFWPADSLRGGRPSAVVRQAVRPRLVSRHRLGPNGARARAPGGCRRGDEGALVEAFVLLTEIPFDRYLDDPAVVL